MVVVAVHLVGIGKGIRILVTVRLLVLLRLVVVPPAIVAVAAVVRVVIMMLRPLQGVALLRVRRLLVVEVVAAGVRMPSGAPAVIDIGTVAAVHRVGEALSGIILIIN